MSLTFAADVPERGVEVTLDVADGETVALLGPNGAGKSTVLAAIAGLLRPERCQVVLDGRPLSVHGTGRARRCGCPRTTARWRCSPRTRCCSPISAPSTTSPSARAAAAPAGRRHGETGRRWLAEVGVEEYADRRPAQLSGGQAQRVAIARALAADPRLLLLDEPMAALDVAVAPAVRQTLRRVLQDRSAVIVTHDVLDALLLADRVVVLDDGRVVEEGPSSVVLAEPRSAFAARIAGLNLIEGTWHDGGLVTDGGIRIEGTAADPSPTEADHAVAVFRPTRCRCSAALPAAAHATRSTVTVTHLEPLGDRVRVHAAELSADITPQAAADLDLAPGAPVLFIHQGDRGGDLPVVTRMRRVAAGVSVCDRSTAGAARGSDRGRGAVLHRRTVDPVPGRGVQSRPVQQRGLRGVVLRVVPAPGAQDRAPAGRARRRS